MKPLTPKWLRIVRILTRRIEKGQYPAGSKFPSQRALCEEFDVSRITITRVEIEMKHNGLIEGPRGITRVMRKYGKKF